MTVRKTAKPKVSNLFSRLSAPLFSETHVEECRAKFSALSDDDFITTMRKAIEINADPLKGDIYIKRRADGEGFSVIATITAMRAYAQSQGDYAADDQTAHILTAGAYTPEVGATVSVIVRDPSRVDPKTNPEGIDYCAMGVYRKVQGDWRRFSNTVTWSDYVPTFDGAISGEAWLNIPYVMIQKVAEVGALRKAYPSLGAIYVEEEMAQADRKIEGDVEGRFSNASGSVPRAARSTRMPKAPPVPPRGQSIDVNFLNDTMTPVPVGEFEDRVANYLQAHLDRGHPDKVLAWADANVRARQEFFRVDEHKGGQGAVRLKRFLEIAELRMRKQSEAQRGRGRARAAAARGVPATV